MNASDQRIVHVCYIAATPAAVWDALTNPDVTQRYWYGTRIESDWKVGSKILYVVDGKVTDEHTVLAIDVPRRLVHTFHPVFGEFETERPSRVTLTIEQSGAVVRLTLAHDDFPPDSAVFVACSKGWPMILNNLKTLLETGAPLPAFEFP
jgi:uncharacterized protein YndB with AHSA1/START domain